MERILTLSKKTRKAQVWIGFQKKGFPTEILLFKLHKGRGGGWHPVTGGVEDDETFLEGAKREVLEETGIKPSQGEWIDLEFSYFFEGRWGHAEEHVFGYILHKKREDPVLDPKEHVIFEWVSVEEAARRLEHDPQRDALKRFSCYLQ